MNLASQLFEVVRRFPDRKAISSDTLSLSFAELGERVSRIGGSFASMLAPGDRVAVDMENCGEVFELYFACWTAGICLVPINSKLHPKEVAYILQSSGAKLLITSPAHADELVPLEKEVAGLRVITTQTDRYEKLLDGEPMRPREVKATDPAWIFYTSGTTGRPKGAVLSHRNLMFMSHAYYADIDALSEKDTQLHIAPLSHGGGLYSLPHLFKGSHQVVLGGSFEPSRVLEAITQHQNVTFFAAPTVITRLVNFEGTARADLTNVKTIHYGGGPMYVTDLKKALKIFGPRMYQLFGQGESPMTISGVSQAMHANTEHPRYEEILASCGYPRTGVEVKVVDADDRDLPLGEIGEVITRSDCMMQSYWGNEKASAETLRGGWLHTGDLGSMDADGLLTLRDRSKDMIISGGSNIYPRELEEVLLRHPDVLEVSVVGRAHPDWGEEVVAFVVAKPGKSVERPALDELCLGNLARFKRPREYRFVEALPKNNYGKVLKTELRQKLQSGAL